MALARKGPVKRTVSAPGVAPGLALPTERKAALRDLLQFSQILYGREKIGKSTHYASYPDSLFFATEPGVKGLEVFSLNEDEGVRDWDMFLKGIKLLEDNPTSFRFIIIDTVDEAYSHCLDWVCKRRGIEYPGQDDQGREDFGKSWRAVRKEFTTAIHRILRTGRGVAFTSHSKEETVKSKSGVSYQRVYPTISRQGREVIEALVDFYFYCEYVRDMMGNTQRVIFTHGDEMVWAGCRPVAGVNLPQFLPLTEAGGYELLQSAFNGEDVGIPPAQLLPANTTAAPAKKLLQKSRAAVGKA